MKAKTKPSFSRMSVRYVGGKFHVGITELARGTILYATNKTVDDLPAVEALLLEYQDHPLYPTKEWDVSWFSGDGNDAHERSAPSVAATLSLLKAAL